MPHQVHVLLHTMSGSELSRVRTELQRLRIPTTIPPHPVQPNRQPASHPADARETQKVERLGLSFPSSFPAIFGEPPELDPARFIWMQFQPKLSQPFPKVL